MQATADCMCLAPYKGRSFFVVVIFALFAFEVVDVKHAPPFGGGGGLQNPFSHVSPDCSYFNPLSTEGKWRLQF